MRARRRRFAQIHRSMWHFRFLLLLRPHLIFASIVFCRPAALVVNVLIRKNNARIKLMAISIAPPPIGGATTSSSLRRRRMLLLLVAAAAAATTWPSSAALKCYQGVQNVTSPPPTTDGAAPTECLPGSLTCMSAFTPAIQQIVRGMCLYL